MAQFCSLRSSEASEKRTRTLEHFLDYRISSYGDFSLIAPESKYRKMGTEKRSSPRDAPGGTWELDPKWVTKHFCKEPLKQSLSLVFPSPSVWLSVWGKPKMPWVV